MIPWIIRQRLRAFCGTSMWIAPLSCAAADLPAAPVVRRLEAGRTGPFSISRSAALEHFLRRIYGSGSLQVCRGLEAMIKNMVDLLPQNRAPEFIRELELLRSGVERQFPDPEDRLRDLTPDS